MATPTAEALGATQTTFSFIDAVSNRGYPEIEVPIYLDESKAAQLINLNNEIYLADQQSSKSTVKIQSKADKFENLIKERDELVEELRANKYVVTIRGIDSDAYDKIEKASEEAFPIEYIETQSPITGATIKTQVDSLPRTEWMLNHIRHAHIKSIADPSGAVDSGFPVDAMEVIWAKLPIQAKAHIDEAIEQSQMDVNYYVQLVDEAF